MTEERKIRPKIVDCDPCNGQGWCMVGEVPYECMCGHLKRVAAGMPLYIKQAIVAREHVTLPMVKSPRANLFVEASWSDMRAVVQVLMLTGTNGHISIMDEQELLAAYVGSMAKASKSSDYTGLIYNNISELVSPPSLAIVRLNTLSNRNKAAPGVLIEAVKTRVDYGKPTWLLCDIDRPFNHASFSYSDELIEIVAANFRKVTVPRINRRGGEVVQDFMSNLSSAVSLEHDPSQQEKPVRRGPKIGHDPEAGQERRPRRAEKKEDESVGGLGSIYGAGVSNSKTKFRK
jgi:hypothetical protein